MRLIDHERARRQRNSLRSLDPRVAGRLLERLHAEQPETVAFLRDFVPIMFVGDVIGSDAPQPPPEVSLPQVEDLLLRQTAHLYEVFTREAGAPLRRVERQRLEDAFQRVLVARMEPPEPDAPPSDLIGGCPQPEVFTWAFNGWMEDYPGTQAKWIVGGGCLLRAITDALDDAAGSPDAAAPSQGKSIWIPDRVEEALSVAGDPMRREALAAAESLRDVLTPRFVAELERWLADLESAAEQDATLGMHSLYLLASWREESAAGVFERLFRLDEQASEALMGETRLSEEAWLLASVVGRAPERLVEIVRDDAAGEPHRAAALEALSLLSDWKELDRPRLLQIVRDLFGGMTPRPHGTEWFSLVDLVMQQELIEVAAEAERAFQEEYVAPTLLTVWEFREAMTADPSRGPWEETSTNPQYRDVAEITWWLDDDPEKRDLPMDLPRILTNYPSTEGVTPKPYVAPAQAGRNDPCPCGSGRKFKKCCG